MRRKGGGGRGKTHKKHLVLEGGVHGVDGILFCFIRTFKAVKSDSPVLKSHL